MTASFNQQPNLEAQHNPSQGATPVVVQNLVLPPPSKEIRRFSKVIIWTFYVFLGFIAATVIFVIVFVVMKNKKENNVSPPFQIVNADGKCLSGLEVSDCNQQDDSQIFNLEDDRIKNKKLQACLMRNTNAEIVGSAFQFSPQYGSCQNDVSNAKIQPGRIESFGYCVSSKDLKFRTCTSDREFTWTQKFV
ncbi:hypothetical protein HDU97_008319 [Phlyctochytrium planicorne]|nr:hypothetical protein HDU97_008319 [Phlyctochytrium planicorne]